MINNKKILITGATGFLGYHLSMSLIKKNIKFTAVDIKSAPKSISKSKNVTYLKRSIMDDKFLKKIIKNHDLIFHFAGIAEPERYLTNPLEVININLKPSLEIIKHCEDTKKILFYTSTSEIYGKNPKIPFKEDDDRLLGSTSTSRWCYSTAKSMVEHYLHATSMFKKINFISVRLFNIYGPNLKGRVVDGFIKRAIKNKDLEIYGNGKQTRCFLYVDDCISAFYQILKSKKNYNKTYNIGNDNEISISKFAKLVVKISKSRSKIKYRNAKKKLGLNYEDIPRRVPDLTKIKSIGWKPRFTLEEGIKKTLKNWI